MGEGTLPNQPKSAARDDILAHNSNEYIFRTERSGAPMNLRPRFLKESPRR